MGYIAHGEMNSPPQLRHKTPLRGAWGNGQSLKTAPIAEGSAGGCNAKGKGLQPLPSLFCVSY
jgi:hypothetical protein